MLPLEKPGVHGGYICGLKKSSLRLLYIGECARDVPIVEGTVVPGEAGFEPQDEVQRGPCRGEGHYNRRSTDEPPQVPDDSRYEKAAIDTPERPMGGWGHERRIDREVG
jgi:hypothetical protein